MSSVLRFQGLIVIHWCREYVGYGQMVSESGYNHIVWTRHFSLSTLTLISICHIFVLPRPSNVDLPFLFADSLSHACFPHFPARYPKRHTNRLRRMETWAHSCHDLLSQGQTLAVPIAMASLGVCTAATQAQIHTHRGGNKRRHRNTLATSKKHLIPWWAPVEKSHSFVQTLAWCRSTPYMESFLAFSRNWVSACAGVIPLNTQKKGFLKIVRLTAGWWHQFKKFGIPYFPDYES